MHYIKMSAKRYYRSNPNRRREDKIFLNNTKNSVDNVTLSVYNQGTLKERAAERLEGGKYEIIFSNQKRRTE